MPHFTFQALAPGGEQINGTIDAATAREITGIFTEVVIAPQATPEAKAIFAAKKNLRLLTTGGLPDPRGQGLAFRSLAGGFLVQSRDNAVVEDLQLKVVTKRQPTVEEWEALRFAWRLCAHVKSNTVIFTDARRTLAVGAGQMSRVDAVEVAMMKARSANRTLVGSVAASDAFFPFRDGLDAVAKAGATAVVQPGGSVRDAEVIAAADEQGLAMVFTGRRHFRH